MPLHATPPSRHADVARRLRERGILRELAPPGEPLHLDAAAVLTQDDVCEYRGVEYRVPPIPVHVGLMLVRLQRRLGQVIEADDDDALVALLTLAEEAAVIFREFAVPVSRWRRWHLRLDRRYNPFRAMSAAELGSLLGFFSARQAGTRFSMPGRLTPRAGRAA